MKLQKKLKAFCRFTDLQFAFHTYQCATDQIIRSQDRKRARVQSRKPLVTS